MKPDDVPQWAWDEADDTTYNIETDGHGSIEYTEARASIARLVMKARSQAFEESAKIVEARIELFTSYGSGLTGRNALKEAANSIRSQAIRQHSQKGRDK